MVASRGVVDADFDNLTPCDGWVAINITRHFAKWVPPFSRADRPKRYLGGD